MPIEYSILTLYVDRFEFIAASTRNEFVVESRIILCSYTSMKHH